MCCVPYNSYRLSQYIYQKTPFCSKIAIFLFSAYFGVHFVTIATVKVKLISDLFGMADLLALVCDVLL